MTPASGDGGVDVIAYRDPLGLEPPIIKVQCERTLNTIGGPDVQKLMGTLAPGSTEVGLFITLDTFTSDAISLARSRHDLRLVNGRQLVDMTFDHYEQLDLEWRRLLPLKRLYVLDHEPDAGWGPTGSRSVAHGGRPLSQAGADGFTVRRRSAPHRPGNPDPWCRSECRSLCPALLGVAAAIRRLGRRP